MGYTIVINNHMSFAKNNIGQVHLSEYDNMNIFKIKAITDITIQFTNNFEYNSGASFYWSQYEANTELELDAGLELMIRSELIPTSENGIGTFIITGEFSISGDIRYLLKDNELTEYSFKNLFNGCTSLIDVSELSICDTTEQSCYEGMFKGCTSIETSPALIAERLSIDCYKEMFYGCSSLNYIIIKSLDSLGEDYSENWTYGVSETGKYESIINVEHAQGVNGIPIGWEGVTNFANMYFTIESLKDNNAIKMQRSKTPNNPTLSYSLDDGETWTTTTISGTVTFATINTGDKIIFKGNNIRFATFWDTYNYFNTTKQFKVYGNIMSLFNGDEFKKNSEFNSSTHHCAGLLRTTYLVDASNLILPALTLYESSYNGMFRSATNLVYGPKVLPALNIPIDGYSSMFESCTSLVEAPEILATTVSGDTALNRMFCMGRNSKVTAAMTKGPVLRISNPSSYNNVYQQLFCGNGNIVEITVLISGTNKSFANWLNNVSSTGIIKTLSGTTFTSGVNGLPSGWTVEDYVE